MLHSKVFQAIHKHCLDCSGGSQTNLKNCPDKDCPLFPYRFGEEPNLFADLGSTNKSKKSKPKPYPICSE